jgi:hypothetical protein|uniref:Uncharacterized protein n=1 Tax=Myoviridae sp. ctByu2 TaxID=2827668 RepID=A0A8S5SA35_9CAUD|nr:MAG TPA: hypothetical protein [Myoviridae sp. ctByu2]
MLVDKARFLSYQNLFYRKLQQTPYKIQLEVVTVQRVEPTEDFSFDAFVGDSPRESTFYSFQALYEKEIPNRTREKYGLPKEVNGVVYLSPLQLVPKLGDYHLNWNKTKVHFEGRVQVVDKIVYLEELYGSCVGLQIFIKDDLKGG